MLAGFMYPQNVSHKSLSTLKVIIGIPLTNYQLRISTQNNLNTDDIEQGHCAIHFLYILCYLVVAFLQGNIEILKII